MGIEIERKFLVVREFRSGAPVLVRQGYLARVPRRTIRVRQSGEQAWLTIKALENETTRQEFEYEIPLADAKELLELCERPFIEKNRWRIEHAGMIWEVDEFFGENAGLIVAEIELESADQQFDHPDWLGAEVTHDFRYLNSNLVQSPFRSWPENITK